MANENKVAVESAPAKSKYEVVGLQEAKTMPIEHKGLMYDLAKLTDDVAEKLISEGCPYVAKVR